MSYINFLKEYFDPKKGINVFSYWLWILSLLFFFHIIPYSLLYPLIIGFLGSLIYQPFIKKPLFDKIFTIGVEFIFLSLNFYYHFYIYKKKIFEIKDIIFSIFIFIIYNIYLLFRKTNFFVFYFINGIKLKKD